MAISLWYIAFLQSDMLVQPWQELLEQNFLKANVFALEVKEFAICSPKLCQNLVNVGKGTGALNKQMLCQRQQPQILCLLRKQQQSPGNILVKAKREYGLKQSRNLRNTL